MGKRTYRTQTWEEWYQNAKVYFESFGNLLVPYDYVTTDGYRLGRWIERQRAMFNGVLPSTLDPERCLALEKIGMVWKLEKRLKWEQGFIMAQEYYLEHGNLNVPTDYMTNSGCQLGFWVKEQRKKYQSGHLTEKQVRKLEQCGIVWRFYERKDWSYWFCLAEEYYQKHENLLVPVDYKTEEGDKLGSWIFVQRERYRGANGRKPLSTEQMEALNGLSMVWTLDEVRDAKWNTMIKWVEAYKEHHGHLPLKSAIKAPDGRSMGNWISVQRLALSKGKVSENKAKRLADLGIFPFGFTE